ncbi:MAG TPA: aminoglycoside phosphotransferase family protein [Chloroflexota bacterium]|nr:aminoglycoside phosphotransferase family protein [Chloroflexota bacterium]
MSTHRDDARSGGESESAVILRDVYRQPDAPDPVLDAPTVLGLARRHSPGAREVLKVDETGGEARVYLVATDGPDLVVKAQRPHRRRVRTSLEKEAHFLRHLAALPGKRLPVPNVLGHGHAEAASVGGATLRIEYTVMTRISGDAVQRVGIEGQSRRAALADLGAVLRQIHQAPQEALIESGLFPGDRAPDDLALRLEAPALDAAKKLDGTARVRLLPEAPGPLVRRAIRGLPEDAPPVALHANPGPMHAFVDPTTGEFTGLIDFGDAYLSHPALDLRRWDRHEDRAAVLEGYCRAGPVDATFLHLWRIACVLADLSSLANLPADAPTSEADRRVATITSLLEALN